MFQIVVAIVQTQGKLACGFPCPKFLDSIFLLTGATAVVGSTVVPALMPATPADLNLPKTGNPPGDLAFRAANVVADRVAVPDLEPLSGTD